MERLLNIKFKEIKKIKFLKRINIFNKIIKVYW